MRPAPRHLIQFGSLVFGILGPVFVDGADAVGQRRAMAKPDICADEAQVALDCTHGSSSTPIEASKGDLASNQRELDRRPKIAGNVFSSPSDINEYIAKIGQDRIAIRKAETDVQTVRQEAERSQPRRDGKALKSPVNRVATSPRDFIHNQTPIMTISGTDRLIIDLVVPTDCRRAARLGMTGLLHLRTPLSNIISATVDAIGAASDTFRFRLLLPKPQEHDSGGRPPACGLVGGLFVERFAKIL